MIDSLIRAVLLVSVCAFATGIATAALNASLPPGSNIDLSHWTLDLPVDTRGGTSGKMAEIPASELSAGYSSPWFRTAPDGSVAFWCPVNGAVSSRSTHPRSELRETIDPRDKSVNWSPFSSASLSARVSVERAPESGKVIIGQIHGYGEANVPLLMINYNYNAEKRTGNIIATWVDTPAKTRYTKQTLAVGIPLGEQFTYEIKCLAGTVTVSVNGHSHGVALDTSWRSAKVYFKAGAYVIDSGTNPSIGGLVQFYKLTASHSGKT